MRLSTIIIGMLLFATITGFAGEVKNLFRNANFSNGMTDWETIQQTGKFCAVPGGIELDLTKTTDASSHKLQQEIRLNRGDVYRLSFTTESDLPQERWLVLSYRMHNKSKNLGVFNRFGITQGRQLHVLEFVPAAYSDTEGDPEILSFYLGELDGKIRITDLQLINRSDIAAEKPPFANQWTIFGLVDPKDEPGSTIPATVSGMDGKAVEPLLLKVGSNDTEKGSQINLRLEAGASRQRFRDAAVLYNEFYSDKDRLIPVGFAADWWMEIRLNGKVIYSTMTDGNVKKTLLPSDHPVFLPVSKGKNVLAIKVLAGSEGWRLIWGAVQPPPKPIRFGAAEGYLPVDLSHPVIAAGSALDLSALNDAPAGKYGRGVINDQGELAFENKSEPFRLMGFSSSPPEDVWKTCSDTEFEKNAVEYAQAIRRQGYNFFRMHGFDQWLMAYSTEDMKPLPKMFDRWDRMIAEMKKQGIYVQLNLFAFTLFVSDREWYQMAESRMARKNMFLAGRPFERERFAKAAQMVLEHVNPYTGLAWKDDPAIIAVEPYNELGLGVEYAPNMQREYPDMYRYLVEKWSAFVHEKYASAPADKLPGGYNAETLKNPPLLPFWDKSQIRVDYDEFWYNCVKEANHFAIKTLRDLGYQGLIVQCPMPALRCAAANWETLQIPDGHTYHCHPWNGEQPGSIVETYSSIEQAASAFRDMHGKRLYGRPFFSNEYNYVFRNPYQYESPIAYAAYASLNHWSSLGIHAGAVTLKIPKEMRCNSFEVYQNPVLRAGEFLAVLFFRRGDVAPAKHKMAVAVPKEYVFAIGNGCRALAPTQSRLSLLTDFSVMFPELSMTAEVPQTAMPDLVIRPEGASDIVWHGWFAQAKENAATGSGLENIVAEMRQKGILPADNKTDLANEIYQSETGEITLRAKDKIMTLITARSEAVALPAGKGETLATLKVGNTSVNALVGLAAVDDRDLADSEHMVLVYSTRAANTGMEHDSQNEQLLRIIGTAPILLESGKLAVNVKSDKPLRCFALRIDGVRTEEIPVNRTANSTAITLDTAKLKNGPTPFFELSTK